MLNPSNINIKQILLAIITILLAVALGYLTAYFGPIVTIGLLIGLVIFFILMRQPTLGILLIVFFLPFERIGSYEWQGITIRISHLIALLLIVVWPLSMLVKRKIDFVRNPIFFPLLIFILINVLSLVNALNLERSLSVLAFTIFILLVGLLVPNLVRNKEMVQKIIIVLLIGFTIVSLFGLYQFIGDMIGLPNTLTGLRGHYTKSVLGFPRIQSTALEPLYFANYLLIPLALLFALFLSKVIKIKSIYIVGLLILGGVNLILTVSRGGYIAFAAMMLVVGLFYLKSLFAPRKIITIILIFIVIALGTVRFMGQENLDIFWEHTRHIFYGASYAERIENFEIAQSAYQKHPWIGVGVGGFGPYASAHPYYVTEEGWKIVNNEFLELLTEVGVLGLATFVVIILILIVRSLKAIKITKDRFLKASMIGFLAAFIGILVQYQTFSVLYIIHIWFLIGMMVAVQNLILLPTVGHKS